MFPLSNAQSVFFDGTDDFLDCGNNHAFERTDPFTVSVWVRMQVQADYRQLIGNYTFFGGSTRGWSLEANDGTALIQYFFMSHWASGNAIELLSTTATYPVAQWAHIAMTYDASSTAAGTRVYLDGALVSMTVAEDALVGSTVEPAQILKIGSGPAIEFHLGHLDEISLWSGALGAAQVARLYNMGKPTDLSRESFSGSLLSWWRMGDGDVFPTIRDVAGGVNCTMVNMTAGSIVTSAP